jgi:hypothetical protein
MKCCYEYQRIDEGQKIPKSHFTVVAFRWLPRGRRHNRVENGGSLCLYIGEQERGGYELMVFFKNVHQEKKPLPRNTVIKGVIQQMDSQEVEELVADEGFHKLTIKLANFAGFLPGENLREFQRCIALTVIGIKEINQIIRGK